MRQKRTRPILRPAWNGHTERRHTRFVLPLLWLLGFLLPMHFCNAAAPVDVSFPLEGHYREGRYMPVRVGVVDAGTGTVTLTADGALATDLPVSAGRTDVVVPWLALRELSADRKSTRLNSSHQIIS